VLVITRHVTTATKVEDFLAAAGRAAEALAERPGCQSVQVARAIDDPATFCVVSQWDDVGSYRRALSNFEVKIAAVPLLATAADEPSAFEVLLKATEVGISVRDSDRAADADTAGPA
jgi:quinol monooxygenase YgiN